MPTNNLSTLIEKVNNFRYINFKFVSDLSLGSSFNSNALYIIEGIKVTITTSKSTNYYDSLYVVRSTPKTDAKNKLLKNLASAQKAEYSIIENKIASNFNHIYLYRDINGMQISEYMPCSDLFQFCKSPAAEFLNSLEHLRHLTAQILLAINAYHQKNLAHRDIKPENFLVREQDGMFIVKLGDHDEVISVNNSGIAVLPPENTRGTEEYRSPELKAAHNSHSLLAKINYKANDCFAAGIALQVIYRDLLAHANYKTIVDQYADATNDYISFLTPHWTPHGFEILNQIKFFTQITAGLSHTDPKLRLTVQAALKSHFFGANHAEIKGYLKKVTASAYSRLALESNEIKYSISMLNSTTYLLPPTIKKIYFSGRDVANMIGTFTPCFTNYTEIRNGKFIFRQIKTAANKHNDLVKTLDKEKYPESLHKDLHDFEVALQDTIEHLDQTFYANLSLSIKHVINRSVYDYTMAIAKQNLCLPGLTLFQKLNAGFAAELNTQITVQTDYKESFKLISDFIGKSRGFGQHTFKNILMENLLQILHENLNTIREKVKDDYPPSKRRCIRV